MGHAQGFTKLCTLSGMSSAELAEYLDEDEADIKEWQRDNACPDDVLDELQELEDDTRDWIQGQFQVTKAHIDAAKDNAGEPAKMIYLFYHGSEEAYKDAGRDEEFNLPYSAYLARQKRLFLILRREIPNVVMVPYPEEKSTESPIIDLDDPRLGRLANATLFQILH